MAEIRCEEEDVVVRVLSAECRLLDVDLEIGTVQPVSKKVAKEDVTQPVACEWSLYTDGSREGHDDFAYWGFILKRAVQAKRPGVRQCSGRRSDSGSGRTVGAGKKENKKSKSDN